MSPLGSLVVSGHTLQYQELEGTGTTGKQKRGGELCLERGHLALARG